MTAADPRDGLPERVLALLDKHGGWQATLDYIANLEALAHARPEAVNEAAALEVLLDALSEEHGGEHHEDGCDVCRAIATLTPERAP